LRLPDALWLANHFLAKTSYKLPFITGEAQKALLIGDKSRHFSHAFTDAAGLHQAGRHA
jgi:hypothetical protein